MENPKVSFLCIDVSTHIWHSPSPFSWLLQSLSLSADFSSKLDSQRVKSGIMEGRSEGYCNGHKEEPPVAPMSDNAFFDYRDNFTIIQNDAIYRDNIALIFKH